MCGFRSGGGILSTISPSFSYLWRVFRGQGRVGSLVSCGCIFQKAQITAVELHCPLHVGQEGFDQAV